ncbi:sn-glycerol-3-phosphate ABC transporter ATP-binding protein UgpC [Helcococcus kunzii]|uniref:ABC transporter ATP-binding protein n=1 Tax=Helcococcus kunzii TaxID=40091 RepID=UPI001BAF8F73|nr:sn-glycerol-3-phosphate ABC transporter ATP-binding protein UgpC [Helcococcus kunzii]QUY64947.1 sn-glycerol-3-phosphate ABC transporter ATP-binding protein UgpC [Helcococcus kunzii]QZO75654.1 sn-glycerol-3-phosphate ABC transporter ATP-binding protein UgpC [Helcococcus kunzii]
MATLKLNNINKIYDNGFQAVYDFNLDIKDKEFIIFVGPSGCGKSTTLRMIAGLEEITEGEFYINDKLMNYESPKDRNIAMVFQSYALYPHMTVYDNMAFGLKLKKQKKEDIDKKVKEAAEILEISELLDRLPKQLSGGQRQRVALGRAIVRNADVFLMDEPLSNLDAKLRVQMRSEIIQLHRRLGTTTIYVTHDQTEAMTMATRLVVMNKGYIQQVGTPREIYQHPENIFVASFIGSPAMNFINGQIQNGKFVGEGVTLNFPKEKQHKVDQYEGKDIVLGVRPEELQAEGFVSEQIETPSTMKMDVDVVELLGHEYIIHGRVGNTKILSKINVDIDKFSSDITEMNVVIDSDKLHLFDIETEKSIF